MEKVYKPIANKSVKFSDSGSSTCIGFFLRFKLFQFDVSMDLLSPDIRVDLHCRRKFDLCSETERGTT